MLEPALESSRPTPIQTQICDRLRTLVANGQLKAGDRLPSLRAFSGELGVARGTVEAAYARLIGEGYLEARGARGTFVAQGVRAAGPAPDATVAPSAASQPAAPGIGKLQLGVPALDAFPRKVWARQVARRARAASGLHHPSPCGFPPLREALAAYLHRSRGVACAADQVMIVPGYVAAIGLIGQTLLSPGAKVWVESPGYPPTSRTFERLGMSLVGVPVDAQGIQVEQGMRHGADARLAVVTPSHQSPLGVPMSMSRRTALLAWAGSAGAWIVEDDYDGEFRYTGHPLPALKSLDRADRVIYAGTFSKVLFPGLRIAYLVVPRRLVASFERVCEAGIWGHCPELLQAATHDFIIEGHFARHVKKMRTLYAVRRSHLADALRRQCGTGIRIHLTEGGMHLLVGTPPGVADVELVRRARAAGFGIRALSEWAGPGQALEGLLMGFTNLRSAEEANAQVAELLRAFSGARAA